MVNNQITNIRKNLYSIINTQDNNNNTTRNNLVKYSDRAIIPNRPLKGQKTSCTGIGINPLGKVQSAASSDEEKSLT